MASGAYPNAAMQTLFEGTLNFRNVGAYFGFPTDDLGHERGMAIFEHFGIVPNRQIQLNCPTCNGILRSVTDRVRTLRWRYRCTNNHKFEPTNNTFLYNIRLRDIGADKLFEIIHLWLMGTDVPHAAELVGLTEDTVMAHYSHCRDVANKIAWHDYKPIGGADDIVEVGGSLLFRRNNRRSVMHRMRNVWVFGGISRKTGKLFAKLVERRSEDHLPIMQENIDANTFICSDMRDGYISRCDQHFAGHETVNQSENSLDSPRDDHFWAPPGRFHNACFDHTFIGTAPQNGMQPYRVHIHNVEKMWRRLVKMAKRCTSRQKFPAYLGEFMYRQNILRDTEGLNLQMVRFLTDIRRAYPGVGKKPMIEDRAVCDCHECVP